MSYSENGRSISRDQPLALCYDHSDVEDHSFLETLAGRRNNWFHLVDYIVIRELLAREESYQPNLDGANYTLVTDPILYWLFRFFNYNQGRYQPSRELLDAMTGQFDLDSSNISEIL